MKRVVEFSSLLANELWKMTDKLCSFIREYVMLIFTKSLFFYPVDYAHYTGRRFTVYYEMKTHVTWIYSASRFAIACTTSAKLFKAT